MKYIILILIFSFCFFLYSTWKYAYADNNENLYKTLRNVSGATCLGIAIALVSSLFIIIICK